MNTIKAGKEFDWLSACYESRFLLVKSQSQPFYPIDLFALDYNLIRE
jgi:hypothetical protein